MSLPSKPLPASSLHSPWVNRMLRLQPGETMTLSEAEVVERGSTLRSAKMTMWHRARLLDLSIWFQRRRTNSGEVLDIRRPADGEVRRRTPCFADSVRQVRRLGAGETLRIEHVSLSYAGGLHAALAEAGVAASIRRCPGPALTVLRWRDELARATPALKPGLGTRQHQHVETKLAGLRAGGSVDMDYQPLLYRPVVRRLGRLLGIHLVTETARDQKGVRVLRVRRLAKAPEASPLRPWLARFKQLKSGQSYTSKLSELADVGATYERLSARLHGLAMAQGIHVSVRKQGDVVVVRKLC